MLLKEPLSMLQPHSEEAILSILSIYNWDFFFPGVRSTVVKGTVVNTWQRGRY